MIDCTNLKPMHEHLGAHIASAAQRVLDSGLYILGKEVEAFEASFAHYHGIPHAVGVANGTDAIELALRAGEIGPGDEVITVAHTAVATVCAIERAGATPVLVDVDSSTYTMNPAAAEAAITSRTKAIVAVHLYGHPASLHALSRLAQRNSLLLIEDCAQAHGARYGGHLIGTIGQLGAFSFYPTKNLGAYGDGGAILTRDGLLADRLRRLRNYGQTTRYLHQHRGINSRLDEMQAAILNVKLNHLDEHNAERRAIAGLYHRQLKGVILPVERDPDESVYHVYHLYVVRHPERNRLREALQARGIRTLIHYPVPVHRQPAFANLGYAEGSLPVTESLAREILSLPMYVGLAPHEVAAVAEAVISSLEEIAA